MPWHTLQSNRSIVVSCTSAIHMPASWSPTSGVLYTRNTAQERDSQTEYSRLEIDLSSTGEWIESPTSWLAEVASDRVHCRWSTNRRRRRPNTVGRLVPLMVMVASRLMRRLEAEPPYSHGIEAEIIFDYFSKKNLHTYEDIDPFFPQYIHISYLWSLISHASMPQCLRLVICSAFTI